jgi:hypothetical protein
MKVRSILVAIGAIALSVPIVTSASARSYHHRHHHGYHAGYHAFAQGRVPSGPASLRFQNGSGWNNGRLDRRQYGRPGHW